MSENEEQIGGTHYQGHDVQHWDYAYARGFDCFQYIITKWVERWRKKGGIQDLYKARHAINKYIEIAEADERRTQAAKAGAGAAADALIETIKEIGGADRNYVDQD